MRLMRISHRHKFIFFANPKTGSTSVSAAINKFSDISDTPYTDPFNPISNGMFYSHILPTELEKHFADCGWDWDAYFKFAFVRNPWDRQLSYFCYMMSLAMGVSPMSRHKNQLSKEFQTPTPPWVKEGKGDSWQNIILDYARKTKIAPGSNPPRILFEKEHFIEFTKKGLWNGPQTDWLCDSLGNNLDYIGQMETMQEDFNLICDRIGIPRKTLSKMNYINRPHRRTFYDEETRENIYNKEKDIIKDFNYVF